MRMRWLCISFPVSLLDDLRHDAGADRLAALADGKAKPLLHRDRRDQRHHHLHVVPRHHHLGALRQLDRAGDIGRPEVELRPVVVEERRMPPAFFFAKDVDLALELGVRRDGTGLGEHLAALDLFSFRSSEENADVVARSPIIEELAEHLHDDGRAGDNVGILLRGTKREEVERGQVLAKPGSITPHAKFECEVYVLSKEEGGRHTPFFNNYRPQFYFRTTDVTGAVELPKGTEMVMPGDNVKMVVTLITPIAMEQGLRFAIREGGKTVGAGVVAKIIE